ncbi:MAG TPA: hypothetical protein PKK32_02100 [Candidatus Paceibacterota bacterium]|nr:hypothetical protein [Candidatus Paceibacterota bacterium]
MITAELISYINDQKTKGKTKENIVSNLLSVGWELNDIEDGFKTIEGSDRYREPITEDDVLDPDKPITDASSFYPQKASFSQEEKTDAKLAEEIKPDIKTSEVETKKEEDNLFFAKDKVVKTEEPLPLEKAPAEESLQKVEGSLGPIGQIKEEQKENIIDEQKKIDAPTAPENLSEPKVEPQITPEQNIKPEEPGKKDENFVFTKEEPLPTEDDNAIKPKETIAEENKKVSSPNPYSLDIPGVEFFDINGNKIDAGQKETNNEIKQTPLTEEKSAEPEKSAQQEISEFLKPSNKEDTKAEDEIKLFKELESSLRQAKEEQNPKEIKQEEKIIPTENKEVIEQKETDQISKETKEIISDTLKEERAPIVFDDGQLGSEEKPKVIETNQIKEEQITPKVSRISVPLANIPKQEPEKKEPVMEPATEAIKKEAQQKVWTPMSIPTKIDQRSSFYPQKDTVTPPASPNRMDEIKRFQESQTEKARQGIMGNDTKPQSEIDPKNIYIDPKDAKPGFLHKQEIGPNFIPKKVVDSVGPATQNVNQEKLDTKEPAKNATLDNISKVAMISSLQGDIAKANQDKNKNTNTPDKKKKKGGLKILLIILFIILIGGGGYFAYSKGVLDNISLDSLGISFIKKSPKELLLNYSNILSSLKSYKTETNIEIISPSLENISRGLLSGEAIISPEKDSISINSIGSINKENGAFKSDSFVTIKGTVLDKYITTDIKDDGSNLYITIPNNIEDVVKDFILKPSIIKVNQEELNSFYSIFAPDLEGIARKLNLYKILSKSIPSFIDNNILMVYNDLISNIDVIEKGEENIKGIDTYRYSITTDRSLVKNLLMTITRGVSENLTEEEEERINQILGSLNIASFDVWVGKGDNNIYQYNIIANVPLSKILGLDDKSIGDNTVSVSWKTTYHDFDIINNIVMPDDFVLFLDYLEEMKKENIKKELNYFVDLASALKTKIKNYGYKSNTDGSCMNPVSGSLFSPTGHPKSASQEIGLISELLNEVMSETNNNGYCYSSSSDWSMAVPISESYQKLADGAEVIMTRYYCVDSIGNKLELGKKPDSPVCPVD